MPPTLEYGQTASFELYARRAAIFLLKRPCWCGYLTNLEQARCTHTATDAHGYNDIFRFAPTTFDERVAHHARSDNTKGMADGNRTTAPRGLHHRR